MKKILFLVVSFVIAHAVNAYDFMVNGLCYNINADGQSVTVTYQNTSNPRYSNASGSLVIPESVFYNGSTYSVTAIGDYAFSGCTGFTGSLTIPNSVTSIGASAFYGCRFTGSLTIPNSVTAIGASAFESCSGFTGSLTIPNSVTSIGNNAFSDCSGFTGSLTIPNSVTAIGDGTFKNCIGFTGSLTIPNSVTAIGSNAFYGCCLTGSLTIPNSVTYIGKQAFEGCRGFGRLTIGNSVTTIGSKAFNGCSSFRGELTIPNSVTTIGTYAFYRCSGFSGALTIPNSVGLIGSYAFYECTGFNGSLTIGNSVTTIGTHAFYGCRGFTGSLTIGNSVTTIGNYAFESCSGFTGSLTIGNSVTTIGNYAFESCSGFTGSLTIPNSVTRIEEGTFKNCSGFTGSLTIPNSVTTIVATAFYGCRNFTSLTIPNSVRYINSSVFEDCRGLRFIYNYIDHPSNVTLGSDVFKNIPKDICLLFVNDGRVAEYQNAAQWQDFLDIRVMGDYSPATGITLNQSQLLLEKGESQTLTATVTPDNANKSVTWQSSNTSVARVSSNGVVTAITAGSATITATTADGSNLSATCAVTVYVKPTGISLNKTSTNLFVGDSERLIATVTPNDATNKNVNWYTSNSSVATVNNEGVVTAVGTGTATIAATVDGTNLSATCAVTVITEVKATGISLNKTSTTITAGDSETLTATITPSNATNKSVTWQSSDTSVATVNSNGVVTAVSIGTATITATTADGSNLSASCAVAVVPYDFMAGGLCYNINADGRSVTVTYQNITSPRYSNASGSLVIPESVTYNGNSYSVTSVGDNAFEDCSGFTGSLTVGNSVTNIGTRAFFGCSGFTGSLTVGNSVTNIGNYAFYGCRGFTGSLSIPNSVETIGSYAFRACSGFNGSLTIGNSVTNIGDCAFWGCGGFTGSVTIPNTMTRIRTAVFRACSSLTSISIPSSVTNIGNSAFLDCTGLTSLFSYVDHPSNVTLGSGVFQNIPKDICVLFVNDGRVAEYQNAAQWQDFQNIQVIGDNIQATGITLNQSQLLLQVGETQTLTATITPSNATNKSVTWQSSNTSVATVSSEGVVTAVAAGSATITATTTDGSNLSASCAVTVASTPYDFMAGGLCYNFNSDGSSVTVTSQNATSPRYSSLNGTLAIPSSVSHLGNTYTVSAVDDSAFQGCSGITALTIPVSLISIGEGAFAGCSGITVVNWNAKSCQDLNPYEYEYWGSGHVWEDEILTARFIAEKLPFYNLTNIQSIVFGNTVERIPAHMCHGLTGLTSVNIPSAVTVVGDSAFTTCSGLTSVTFSNSVAVGKDAFRNCETISRVNISDLEAWCNMGFTTSYSNPLFYAHHLYLNGTKVTNLVLPNNVTSVGGFAFENCDDLISLSLHDEITSIGESAFINCTGLTGELNIPQSLHVLGHNAFSNCSGLTVLNWNAKSCTFSIAEWEQEGHTASGGFYNHHRGMHPFYNTHFNHVEFGDEVELIPDFLCLDFSSISTVTIPENVTTVGLCSFMGCTSLTSVQWNAIECESGLDSDDIIWEDDPLWMEGDLFSHPSAFRGLSNINSFMFGNKVKQVPNYLCYNLTGLSTITIPSTVNYIGTQAFGYCTGLDSIFSYVDPSKVTLGNHVFYNVPKDGVLHVLPQYLSTYQQTNQWKEFFNIVDDLEVENPPVIPGDVNGDNTVNVSDYVTTASYILEQNPQPFFFVAADLDESGTINVTDLVGVAAIALTFEQAPRLAPAQNAEAETLQMDAEMEYDNELTIDLNNGMDITALQMDLTLPQGVTVAEAALTDRASASHTAEVAQLGNGDYRILVASGALRVFNGHDGALLRIKLSSSPESALTLYNIHLASPNAEGLNHENIVLAPIVTAVSDIYAETRIYAENGHIVVETPADGQVLMALPNGMSFTRNVKAGRNLITPPTQGILVVKMNEKVVKIKY